MPIHADETVESSCLHVPEAVQAPGGIPGCASWKPSIRIQDCCEKPLGCKSGSQGVLYPDY